MSSIGTYEKRWVDDYLDLLNYAQRIGDVSWQQEIIGMLSDGDRRQERARIELREATLWRQFDAINARMLELYRQLRETRNAHKASGIIEEVWGLKARRIEIGRQLNASPQSAR